MRFACKNFKCLMIHASSISKKEVVVPRNLRDVSIRVRDVEDKFKYNTLQFRGLVSAAEAQTDVHIEDGNRVSAETQVNLFDIEINNLKGEISMLQTQLENELIRSTDRERILIAQMNAIRDQQVVVQRRLEKAISITVRLYNFDLNLSRLPVICDCVSFSVSAIEAVDENPICSRITEFKDIDLIVESKLADIQVRTIVPQDAGKMYLLFTGYAFKRGDDSCFKLVLGEWSTQPFVPCLKDLHKPEMFRILFPACGVIDAELIFS